MTERKSCLNCLENKTCTSKESVMDSASRASHHSGHNIDPICDKYQRNKEKNY